MRTATHVCPFPCWPLSSSFALLASAMRLLLILLLLTSVALAEDWNWRELKVKGSLTCGHHGTADIWIFKASLVRQPKFIKIDKVEVVE